MPASRLCRLCRGITAEALTSKAGYAHAARPEHLGNPCDLCRKLGLDYVPDYDPDSGDDPDGNSGYSKWNLRLGITVPHHNVSYLKLSSEIWPGPDEEWRQDLYSYYLLTPEGDPAAKCGIPTVSRDLSSTRSAETFAFIKACLDQCDLEHNCTSVLELDTLASQETKPAISRALHPARLICLSGSDESSIRLVQILDQECPIYMTLSHCWGLNVPKNCLTTESNLEQRLQTLHVSILPPSFRDAIEITRRLGVHFLWIDTLCVLQDSEKDWAIESVKMGSIYQNSMLTIAASHAQNSFGGCFNQQSISRDRASMASSSENDTIEITGEDSHGIKTTLIMFKVPFGDMPDILENSPLHKRGWIFQERVLSPRTVHFTSSQVVWECRKEYWFEDRIPWRARGANSRPMSFILRPHLWDYTKSTLFSLDMKAARIADHWYADLVADRYSVRAFTKPVDRLIALAGIAGVYQQLTKDRYVAGLWGSSLAAGLSWVKRSWLSTVPNTTTGSRWPTWSWASQDDPIDFDAVHSQPQKVVSDPCFSLVDTQLEYSPEYVNDFSPIVGGFITVTGCLVDLMCDRGSCSYPQDWHQGWKGSCYIDDEWKDSLRKRVTALVIARGNEYQREGDLFLLLKSYGERDSAYIRMGFAKVDYSPFLGKSGWEDTTEKAAQIRAARRPQAIHLY